MAGKHASVHPCRHGAVMKKIIDVLMSRGVDPEVDKYVVSSHICCPGYVWRGFESVAVSSYHTEKTFQYLLNFTYPKYVASNPFAQMKSPKQLEIWNQIHSRVGS